MLGCFPAGELPAVAFVVLPILRTNPFPSLPSWVLAEPEAGEESLKGGCKLSQLILGSMYEFPRIDRLLLGEGRMGNKTQSTISFCDQQVACPLSGLKVLGIDSPCAHLLSSRAQRVPNSQYYLFFSPSSPSFTVTHPWHSH